ncbi:MAG: hypothetical protein OEY96_13015 [Gammaproteobacteria bacterium]|nr:hypothetical protein [Gammaproteobacteria bacterium]
MKYLIFVILFLCSNISAYELNGTWVSDKEKTLKWIGENLKEDVEFTQDLSKILGHHYITYHNEKTCSYMSEWKTETKTNEAFSMPTQKYNIIAKNDYGFVVSSEHYIFMLIFESDNSYYGVALDTEEYGHPGSREYYKRIEPNNEIRAASKDCFPT